ncbi:MAG: hypothetical protein NDJ89_09725 [Oligoflexia bacterium]|nr:hypothetical protein [Oligoflexia bacterium]
MKEEPPIPEEESPTLGGLVLPAAPKAAAKSRIQPAARRGAQSSLSCWNAKQLQSASDPLGHGIAHLLEKGATSILFLAIQTLANSPAPHFHSTAYAGGSDKLRHWNGLHWDPAITPSIWNHLVQSGYVELAPPSAAASRQNHYAVIRSAFGLASHEWLLLLRAGPTDACRGVVCVVSPRSLLKDVDTALKLIGSRVTSRPKLKKAA